MRISFFFCKEKKSENVQTFQDSGIIPLMCECVRAGFDDIVECHFEAVEADKLFAPLELQISSSSEHTNFRTDKKEKLKESSNSLEHENG